MSDPIIPAGSWVELIDRNAVSVTDPAGNEWCRTAGRNWLWSSHLRTAIRRSDIVVRYPEPSVNGSMRWVPHGLEETHWIAVDEHSPAQRYKALRTMEFETGEPWKSFNARRCWVRAHELDRCGVVLGRELPEEVEPSFFDVRFQCWCEEFDGPEGCVAECERNDEGATPAYRIDAR